MSISRRDKRSCSPEIKEELKLREELKREALQTAAYCRLSVLNGDEDSIDTQIEITHSYIEENPELTMAETYIDNGFTGTDFDRPGWNALMRDVQNGRISCIVVKDLSRFGRNHVETGHFIEHIFPMLGVRFISITDNFDSVADDINNGFLVPTKNIMNSLYAKDISHKTRAAFETMKREGKLCNGSMPYGYARVDDRMVIDPEEAPMVKMIFKWAKLGVNAENIVYRLKLMGEIKQNGIPWNAKHIRSILRNPAYIGTYVTGKESYSMKRTKKLPKEAWLVFEGNHEPIISREDFEIVGAMLEEKKVSEISNVSENSNAAENKKGSRDKHTTSPLKGLVFCSVCGKRMSRGKCVYYCQRHTGKNATEENIEKVISIPERELKNRIIRRIKVYREELEDARVIVNGAERRGGILDNITVEATAALAEKKKAEEEGELLFDRLNKKEISERKFKAEREKYWQKMEQKQDVLNGILKRQRKARTAISKMKELLKASDGINRVKPEHIRIFVERVDVLPSGYTKIRLKCQDVVQGLMKGEIE